MIARKLGELFGFNRGISPFYAACHFNELSRGSVSYLLNASFEKRVPQHHNSIFYAEIDDHGVRRDNTGQILARSRHSVASRVALDLPYWAMHLAPYRLIRTARKMKSIIFSFILLILLKPFDGSLVQPLPSRLPGLGYARPSKSFRWRGKRLHHGGDVCVLCLASQNPFEREFFVPAGTDLGVKLLTIPIQC